MGRIIVKLEEIYGIVHGGHGGNQYQKVQSGQNDLSAKTQKDLQLESGISEGQWKRYKKLTELIPELQHLAESGDFKTTLGVMIAKLPKDEQTAFLEEHSAEQIKKMTQRQTQEYVDRIKALENKPPKIIDNTDYNTIELLKEPLSCDAFLGDLSDFITATIV